MNNLVTTDWLEKNLSKVRVIDATWHMPNLKRESYKDYLKTHISGSVFFDLDKSSDEKSSLPHMMPDKDKWERIVTEQGIKNSDQLIIYDNSDTFSSCRCWFTFIYFGHDPNRVSILDGGFIKWINENRHLLKPPVGNKNLYVEAGDFIVMIVAGPNARKDYHYNETEELFYQVEGDIVVKTQQEGKLVEYNIKEGEMFLLPAKVPHSPVRPEGSIAVSYTHLTLPTNREV